jgi:hypothetical protein
MNVMLFLLVGLVLLFRVGTVAAQPQCLADRDGDVRVTIDEVVTTVHCALQGCPPRFTDNGDGTVTDNWTYLMWEKKSADGSVHDATNAYVVSNSGFGTTTAEFLAMLNDEALGGHTDWRLPTIGELQDLVEYAVLAPSIDPMFDNSCASGCTPLECSCTAPSSYWSSTAFADSLGSVWFVDYSDGSLFHANARSNMHARAVRACP